jgi:pyruvate kinase
MSIDPSVRLLKKRRTKIVATLGPASADPSIIERLINAGVNVVRLNFSHGDHEHHRQAFDRVRAATERLGQTVAILADLCGPKIRTGRFEGGHIDLTAGGRVTVTTRDELGHPGLIPSQYEALARDVKAGDRILLDDGRMELRVDGTDGIEIACTVVQGGVLSDRKGMNLPGVGVSAPSLTEKDRGDAAFALQLGVEFLALSFVRRPEDVRELRAIVQASGHPASIIAKIEKPEALEHIEEILDEADGIMVARGDLGVELPPQVVPAIQDQLVDMARARSKPVIVATQMLESMILNSRPTRAEVSDVSHAVSSGADAVMLSAETAAGSFPVEAVEMMDAVARNAEGRLWSIGAFGSIKSSPSDSRAPVPLAAAVARATAQLSRDLQVHAIQVISQSGRTASMVCGARPAAPVLAVSTDPRTCRRMSLLWGALPILAAEAELRDRHSLARRLVLTLGLASRGDYILVVRGFHHEPALNAPTVTVLTV